MEITALTAYGQAKNVTYGNGVVTGWDFDELGRLTDIDTTMGSTTIQDNVYDWHSDGSLESRIAGAAGSRTKREEKFEYDYLNRLTEAKYDPDGSRYFRKSVWQEEEEEETEVEGETRTTTVTKTTRTYYAGAYEKTVTVDGATVERTRIGDSVVHVRTTPAATDTSGSSDFEYLHRDHLGSVEAVTDADGEELVVLGHDPYGERRDEDWTAQLAPTEIEELRAEHGERVSRGFTGHEHLDRTGLIHMNGRVYDPRLGRFLSPDPIVGDPTSSQSWNLYSYVGNNPLSYVLDRARIRRSARHCPHARGGLPGPPQTPPRAVRDPWRMPIFQSGGCRRWMQPCHWSFAPLSRSGRLNLRM